MARCDEAAVSCRESTLQQLFITAAHASTALLMLAPVKIEHNELV